MNQIERIGLAAGVCLLLVAGRSPGEPGILIDPAVRAFHERCAALATAAFGAGQSVVTGSDGWLFPVAELRHLGAGRFWGGEAAAVSQASKPAYADPLPVILDVHRQLEKAGVRLLLVPVPPKVTLYPALGPAAEQPDPATVALDPHHQAFYSLLRAEGVEVLDLRPEFISHRNDPHGPLYCRQDSHWSGAGCVWAARQIADRLKEARPSVPGAVAMETTWREVAIRGDLAASSSGDLQPVEKPALRFVSGSNGERIPPEPDSPVILMGDSHNLVFHDGGDMHAVGAGLPDQLAVELGYPVTVVAVRGSGATPARLNLYRLAQKDPAFWSKRRWVIWCFSAREFTEADGWRLLPIRPASP